MCEADVVNSGCELPESFDLHSLGWYFKPLCRSRMRNSEPL